MKSREDEVYDAIVKYIDKHTWPPSLQELCEMTGLRSKADVHRYLARLVEDGRIVKGPGPRMIRVVRRSPAKKV